jgi:hypothetical protein
LPVLQAPQVPAQLAAAVAMPQTVKLPKRQIRHFKGDILDWNQFWESCNSAIHHSAIHTNLSNIQKFDYLKEYLKGDALLFVKKF